MVLLDFDNLNLHLATVDMIGLTETLEDEDCKLTIFYHLHTNDSGFFATTQARRFFWEPQGCTFNIEHDGHEYTVGIDYTDMFINRDNGQSDIPYSVRWENGEYILATIDEEPVRSAFEDYGCDNPDQLIYRYSPF